MRRKTVFLERQSYILKHMKNQGGGVAFFFSAPKVPRNRDIYYPYRQDSDFYYLTGLSEPDSCLILISGTNKEKSILFCRSNKNESKIWENTLYGPKKIAKLFGFDQIYPIERINKLAPEIISGHESLYIRLAYKNDWKNLEKLKDWFFSIEEKTHRKIIPSKIFDLSLFTSEMRLIKDVTEIEDLRKSAQISAFSHREIMKFSKIGMHEYEIETELMYFFRKMGALSFAYESIVAAGKNACIIHHSPGNSILKDGDLLLIDAGCELNNYASDITRTFPINGKFSDVQLTLYEIVLEAQRTAIEAVIPGNSYNKPHEAAIRVLVQGMLDENLLKGNLESIIESGQYKKFYPHHTSHWIGLDVHDVGSYYEQNYNRKNDHDCDTFRWRMLKPGMVLTIEPGIYIRSSNSIPKDFWNIGIRIEDTILVTENGCEIITRNVPVDPHQIEFLIKSHQKDS